MKELRHLLDWLAGQHATMDTAEQDERIQVLESKVEANRVAIAEHEEDWRAHRKRERGD